MSTLLATGDVWGTTIYCHQAEQWSVQRRYWKVATALGADTDATLAAAVDAMAGAHLLPLLGNDADYVGVRVRQVFPTTAIPVPVINQTSGAAGTAGAVLLPRQTAGLIKFIPQLSSRGRIGHFYAPFPSASDNELDGSPKATYITRLDALATDFSTQLVLSGGSFLNPVLWNRKTSLAYTIVIAHSSSGWATQKRRGFFGRPNRNPF